MKQIKIVAAVSENGVIGKNGGLPWRIPAELQHFRQVTNGHVLICGRKTWDSLGGKPLKGRQLIVLTRNRHPADPPAGVTFARSVGEAVQLARRPGLPIAVIGGEAIYRDCLPLAAELVITRIHARYNGDAHFPTCNPADWVSVDETHHVATADTPAWTVSRYRLK
jgi:dihydrofolate reductase